MKECKLQRRAMHRFPGKRFTLSFFLVFFKGQLFLKNWKHDLPAFLGVLSFRICNAVQ